MAITNTALLVRIDAKMDAMDKKIDAKMDAMDKKIDTKMDVMDKKIDRAMDVLLKHNGRLSSLEEALRNEAEARRETKQTLTGLATKEDLKELEKSLLAKTGEIEGSGKERMREVVEKINKLEGTEGELEVKLEKVEKTQREQELLLTTWKAKVSVVFVIVAGAAGIIAGAIGKWVSTFLQ